MDNFIKALSISMLMSGSFMTQAMDDQAMNNLEAEAKKWGFTSINEYLDQIGEEHKFLQSKPQPQGTKDLQAEARAWGFSSVAEYLNYMAQQSGYIEEKNQTHNDHLLAKALEEEVDPLGAYNLPYLMKMVTGEDIIIYETIVAAAKTIKIDADVHTMTNSFARPHYAETKRLEHTYLGILQQPNKLLTLEEIETDLKELAKRNDAIAKIMPPINDVFKLIKGYWGAPIDGETGLDIREVMSNCFIMARCYGDAALANLAIIMADNIQTQGGCHPGVTGRLAHTFFIEVSAAIGRYY